MFPCPFILNLHLFLHSPGENITKVIVASGLSTVHTSFLRKYMYSQDSSSISSIFCKPEGISNGLAYQISIKSSLI